MSGDTRLILTAPPASAQAASSYGLPVGHIAYRIGPGGYLLRANIPINLRGGLMVISAGECNQRADANNICQQIVRECIARSFDGVILDFEGSPTPQLGQIVSKLGILLFRRGWPLYVTEEYGGITDRARVIIPSALSGGSLSKRLTEALERFGPGKVALGIQRTAEDFPLPSPSGSGVPLSREELAKRIQTRGASIFFSDELCAHYFTYMSRQNGAHFVLFDNAASIRKKIQIAQNLNLCACIMAWPEVDDIISSILR